MKEEVPDTVIVFGISSFLPFIDFLAQKNYNVTIAMHRNVKPKQSDGDCVNEVLNDYGMIHDIELFKQELQ